jgi:predicted nuclease of predicted toxin-antitoxin system
MKLLLDAQLSPFITHWIEENFDLECVSFHHLNWQTDQDEEAFLKAKEMNAIVLTKDEDFIALLKNTEPRLKSSGLHAAILPISV